MNKVYERITLSLIEGLMSRTFAKKAKDPLTPLSPHSGHVKPGALIRKEAEWDKEGGKPKIIGDKFSQHVKRTPRPYSRKDTWNLEKGDPDIAAHEKKKVSEDRSNGTPKMTVVKKPKKSTKKAKKSKEDDNDDIKDRPDWRQLQGLTDSRASFIQQVKEELINNKLMEADKVLPGPGSEGYKKKPKKRSSSRSEYKSDVVKKDPHLSDDDMKSKKRHPILGDIFKDMGSTFDMKKELDKLNISKLPKDKK